MKHSNPFASIDENQFDDVSIYPNPTNGLVNIDFGAVQSARISVININGQLVYQENISNQDNYSFEFDGISGIYFLEIKNEDKRRIVKLIKE
ncbi:MAG TPA: T9SS type A sorting domain-containing protein [Crocinitomicaceae bacterium]|nr:T9SS type A sorting domain-containing protein [Crocinitomicaceae bacterium]